MKKIPIFLLIVPILLFANLNLKKVVTTLSQIEGSREVVFFNADKKILFNGKIRLTKLLNNADIVLFPSKEYQSKATIVNSYKKLKLNKSSIGAIYLKKGRTQIVFIKERLEKYRLKLNSKFKKHLLHEWQLDPKLLINHLKID